MKILFILFLSGCAIMPKYTRKKLDCVERFLDQGITAEGSVVLCKYGFERY